MIAPGTIVRRPVLVERLSERRSEAFINELADTCRAWPALASWLLDEFGRNIQTRERFRALIAAAPGADDDNLATLDGNGKAVGVEASRMLAKLGAEGARRWGGRTWVEMEQLVRRYQAGTLDLGVFMLVRNWRKTGGRSKAAPELRRALVELFDAVVSGGQSHLWANVSSSLALLRRLNSSTLRTSFGHADWWKLHALLYMMRRPQRAYRTREVRAHLAKLGLPISSLDFRRFCNRHSIARDKRAGRPRGRRL